MTGTLLRWRWRRRAGPTLLLVLVVILTAGYVVEAGPIWNRAKKMFGWEQTRPDTHVAASGRRPLALMPPLHRYHMQQQRQHFPATVGGPYPAFEPSGGPAVDALSPPAAAAGHSDMATATVNRSPLAGHQSPYAGSPASPISLADASGVPGSYAAHVGPPATGGGQAERGGRRDLAYAASAPFGYSASPFTFTGPALFFAGGAGHHLPYAAASTAARSTAVAGIGGNGGAGVAGVGGTVPFQAAGTFAGDTGSPSMLLGPQYEAPSAANNYGGLFSVVDQTSQISQLANGDLTASPSEPFGRAVAESATAGNPASGTSGASNAFVKVNGALSAADSVSFGDASGSGNAHTASDDTRSGTGSGSQLGSGLASALGVNTGVSGSPEDIIRSLLMMKGVVAGEEPSLYPHQAQVAHHQQQQQFDLDTAASGSQSSYAHLAAASHGYYQQPRIALNPGPHPIMEADRNVIMYRTSPIKIGIAADASSSGGGGGDVGAPHYHVAQQKSQLLSTTVGPYVGSIAGGTYGLSHLTPAHRGYKLLKTSPLSLIGSGSHGSELTSGSIGGSSSAFAGGAGGGFSSAHAGPAYGGDLHASASVPVARKTRVEASRGLGEASKADPVKPAAEEQERLSTSSPATPSRWPRM